MTAQHPPKIQESPRWVPTKGAHLFHLRRRLVRVPERIVNNADLEKWWRPPMNGLTSRTGIMSCRVAAVDQFHVGPRRQRVLRAMKKA